MGRSEGPADCRCLTISCGSSREALTRKTRRPTRNYQAILVIRDRQEAARNLVLKYRVERAAERMGWIGLLMLLPVTIIVMVMGISVKRYM